MSVTEKIARTTHDENKRSSFRPSLIQESGNANMPDERTSVIANITSTALEKRNGSKKQLDLLRYILDERIKGSKERVAIFTHPIPDPDAIGSQMGMAWLIDKIYGKETDLFIAGEVSHPQNMTMVNLLGPKLIPINQYKEANYSAKILLDTIPSNAARVNDNPIDFDVVIDHHIEVPVVGNDHAMINLHTGSCCSTVFSIINYFGVQFDDTSDLDRQVATALMVGIYTDTCGILSDRTTDYDHEAFMRLFPYRDPESLKNIAKFKRPRSWVIMKAQAASNAQCVDSIAAVGLGMISSKQRDVVAESADEMLSWESINISVAFALVDNDTLQGSVRSSCASMSAARLAKILGEERGGSGWGHAAMAGYRYPIAGFGIKDYEDEVTKKEVWDILNRREITRIFNTMKK